MRRVSSIENFSVFENSNDMDEVDEVEMNLLSKIF